MIDFHNHVLPGVDDGAADLAQALAALRAFAAQGVGTVV
ncbi:MAG: CpsB/CapC family capsule biosynthesis tyrosine phosphatase, partial [Longimicrobiaceae bacterium]